MKRLLVFTVLLTQLTLIIAQQPYDRKMLETALNKVDLKEVLISKDEFHPYPTYNDSAEWDALPQKLKTAILDSANKFLDFDWGQLPATLFLEFHRSGDRSKYASVTYPRRIVLNYLVYAELIERKSRFIDKIIDGIWVICEESSWDVPAHEAGHKGHIFPEAEDPLVALMSAETGAMMAYIEYLIGDKLDEVSPQIRERMYYEVQRRILTPALTKDDKFWMGFNGRWVNNWNPWINSNWLRTSILMERDPQRRADAVKKSLLSLDNFINMYGEDGGCDEGPSYYGHAAAALHDALALIKNATNGKIDIFHEPLIGEMADFVRKAHIDEKYFVNFADAAAKGTAYGMLIYRFGKATGKEELQSFGFYSFQQNGFLKECLPYTLKNFGRTLPNIFMLSEFEDINMDYQKCHEAWLPDIQVLYSRSGSKNKELFFAAKGGHNDESHNHNDVGNFILYANSKPVIIDVGVETYTAKTFSKDRYSIWTMQSQYHNLPNVNGVMEQYGRDFKAEVIDYKSDKKSTNLVLDIASAYSKEAKIETWIRCFDIDKSGKLSLTDKFKIDNTDGIVWNFMAYADIKETEPGKLVLTSKDGYKEQITMIYNTSILNVEFEDIVITDALLKKSWKSNLTRIQFSLKNTIEEGEILFEFE